MRPARGNSGGWIHRLTEPAPRMLPPRAQPRITVDWTERANAMFNAPRAKAARHELAERLGVHTYALERLHVGVGHDQRGEFSSWPERDAKGVVVGIVRRYSDGGKLHMAGGTHGLYVPDGWRSTSGPLLLPEGGSDAAALTTMGLAAIGRPSCLGGVEVLAELLRAQNVLSCRAAVVLGENDQKPERVGTVATCPADCDGCSWCWPGRYGAKVTATKLTAALGRRVHWRMVPDAKDAREWLLEHGPDGQAFVELLRRQVVAA